MPSGFRLRVDQSIIEHDFKPSTTRRDEDEALDDSFELIEQLVGRAHGAAAIASNDAVFDAEFHGDERSR